MPAWLERPVKEVPAAEHDPERPAPIEISEVPSVDEDTQR